MRKQCASQSRFSLNDCLDSLCVSPFWTPLPGREAEISFISEFIRLSFSSEMPRVLAVIGGPKTGKTSALTLSASMSLHGNRIQFANSPDFFRFGTFPDFVPDRRLIIFDDFDSSFPVGEIVEHFAASNFSMVFVSHEWITLCGTPMVYSPSVLNFGRYSTVQFMDILREKMGLFQCVPVELLHRIAGKVSRSRGTVPDAIAFLAIALRAAIDQGKASADPCLPDFDAHPPRLGDGWERFQGF
jgi:hypothetical protein